MITLRSCSQSAINFGNGSSSLANSTPGIPFTFSIACSTTGLSQLEKVATQACFPALLNVR